MAERVPAAILFVSALPEESAAIAGHAPVLHTGPGKVQAAAVLAHRLGTGAAVDLVVNVGTAGALGRHSPGDVIEVGRVAQHDFDHAALSALAGRPLPGGPIELSGPDGAQGRLVTGDTFIADPAERDRLATTADLVDMEGYAVAATCRHFGVRVWITKCVSDSADAAAPMSWRQTLDMASQRLAAWASRRGLLG